MAKELNENTSFKVSVQTLIGIGFGMATIISIGTKNGTTLKVVLIT